MFKVGDKVKYKAGSKGIVRHVGVLEGIGHPNCVWSEWGDPHWDGVVRVCSSGGRLTYACFQDVELDERKKPKVFGIVNFINSNTKKEGANV